MLFSFVWIYPSAVEKIADMRLFFFFGDTKLFQLSVAKYFSKCFMNHRRFISDCVHLYVIGVASHRRDKKILWFLSECRCKLFHAVIAEIEKNKRVIFSDQSYRNV